jgi:hypothetical protein
LLSIDVDSDDYWVWKEIDIVQPMIVVIEAKVEFDKLSIIVPFPLRIIIALMYVITVLLLKHSESRVYKKVIL